MAIFHYPLSSLPKLNPLARIAYRMLILLQNYLKKYIFDTCVPLWENIVLVIFVIVLVFGALLFIPKKPAIISGVFVLKGTIPQNSTVTLFARDLKSGSSFSPVSTGLTAVAGLSAWQYNGSQGKSYAINAGLVENGEITKYSNTIMVKAPAFNQVLSFTFSASDSAAQIASSSAIPSTPSTSSGPPAGSPSPTPTVILKTITPAPTTIVTPSFTPTPTATTSGGIASISGTIQFTGQALLNTRIVIFQRVTGTQNYQVAVDNLLPLNGTWVWTNATSGVMYDILAVLKQKQNNGTDTDLAYASVYSAIAPFSTATSTLASPSSLSAPSPNISVSCITLNATTQTWAANISFQTIQGAQSYWFEIGTTDGGIDLINQTQNAVNGSNQVISPPLKNGTTYYARYSYAAVPNLNSGSNQFSPFSSPTIQLKCSQ